jgi:crotonobetainyl-CoA:carnitine CoA-transferase CaiB-like acyl-CoA transferase
MEEYERIKGVIAAYFESKTKAELFKIAREHNILIAPIATIDEVLDNPQFESRGYWQTVEHPEIGQAFRYPGPFARFSAKPITYRRRPPTVGEHNREIYVGELGMSEGEFDQLVRRGII